jgi:hypothetical protein
MYDEGHSVTEIDLWGPETITAMPGAAAWMRGEDAYSDISELMVESGMHWDYGPFRAAVIATTFEMEEWEEHGTAYDKWCQGEVSMDDLHEPSLFTEWNQGTGESNFVGADQIDKNMKITKFTPEMLQQRDDLNHMFNFLWNPPYDPKDPSPSIVPNQTDLLTLTAVGEHHGVAKCHFGAVFVPRGAIQYLQRNGGAKVGTIFDGEITFTPENKFPWRLTRDGVKFTYEEMGCTPEYY